MTHADLTDLTIYEALTNDLRSFNEKICVVEINIKVVNEGDNIDVKTRKIQSNFNIIQLKYGELTRSTNTFGMIIPVSVIICPIFIFWFQFFI